MAKAKKALAKSSFVEKNLQTALEKLAVATAAVDKAVGVRAKDAKKNTVAVKRLAKRKATLSKRKKLAAGRVKKASSVETRQALRAVTKDLAATTKELAKARIGKSVNAEELARLKVSQRRTKGYNRGISAVDRGIPKK
ncbi:MAG: hypothetical protein JKY37_20370 [Nannocystaceae bacterium]|nr:hypothetical protein [Nannocystaceae bacterium]